MPAEKTLFTAIVHAMHASVHPHRARCTFAVSSRANCRMALRPAVSLHAAAERISPLASAVPDAGAAVGVKTISITGRIRAVDRGNVFHDARVVLHSPAMATNDSAASAVERFLDAVRGQRREEAEALLSAHPRLAGEDLGVACAVGDEREVERQLAADPGAATRARGAERWPPLLYASASRWHERGAAEAEALGRVARRLMAAGASADTYVLWQPDDEKSRLPALFFASAVGNVAATRALLEHGARTNDGESLYHATEFDQRECLELMLAHGADLSSRHPHWGNTPLFFNLG